MRNLTLEQVSSHHTTQSLWVVYKDKVYDITSFLFDHPGGEELLLSHGGSDISSIFENEEMHLHSDSALSLLEDYLIGKIVDAQDSQDSLNTLVEEQVKINDLDESFIDITKPMLKQVFNAKWTKDEYIKQVHIPRYSKTSAPIFGGILEPLSNFSFFNS